MQIHIVLYKWREEASVQQVESALNAIKLLEDKIPGIIEIAVGENTSQFSEGYSHVILVRGEDQAAIDAYRAYPDHQAAAEQIEAIETSGIGVDFATD